MENSKEADVQSDVYHTPEIIVLGDVISLTGSNTTDNLSDGPPVGVGYRKGAGLTPDEAPE